MGCTASTTDNNHLSAKTTNPTINTSIIQQKNYSDQGNLYNQQNTADFIDNEDLDQDLEGDEDQEEDEEEDEDEKQRQKEAALKIQSNYRGYKARKEFNIKDKTTDDNMKEEETAANVSDADKAATTIQAGFKGYKVRKEIKKQKSETNSEDGSPVKRGDKDSVTDEIADIDLNDPEVEKAAIKIQDTFRGYKKKREPKQE